MWFPSAIHHGILPAYIHHFTRYLLPACLLRGWLASWLASWLACVCFFASLLLVCFLACLVVCLLFCLFVGRLSAAGFTLFAFTFSPRNLRGPRAAREAAVRQPPRRGRRGRAAAEGGRRRWDGAWGIRGPRFGVFPFWLCLKDTYFHAGILSKPTKDPF